MLNMIYNRRIKLHLFGKGINVNSDLIRGTKLKDLIVNNKDSGESIINYIESKNILMKIDNKIHYWSTIMLLDIIKIFDDYYTNPDVICDDKNIIQLLDNSLAFIIRDDNYCYKILYAVIVISQILEIDQRILASTGKWNLDLYTWFTERKMRITTLFSVHQEYISHIDEYFNLTFNYNCSFNISNDSINNNACTVINDKIYMKLFGKAISLNKDFVQQTKLKDYIDVDIGYDLIQDIVLNNIDVVFNNLLITVLTRIIFLLNEYFDYSCKRRDSMSHFIHSVYSEGKVSLNIQYKITKLLIEKLSIQSSSYDALYLNKRWLCDLYSFLVLLLKLKSMLKWGSKSIHIFNTIIEDITDCIHPKINKPTYSLSIILMNNSFIRSKMLHKLKTDCNLVYLRFI